MNRDRQTLISSMQCPSDWSAVYSAQGILLVSLVCWDRGHCHFWIVWTLLGIEPCGFHLPFYFWASWEWTQVLLFWIEGFLCYTVHTPAVHFILGPHWTTFPEDKNIMHAESFQHLFWSDLVWPIRSILSAISKTFQLSKFWTGSSSLTTNVRLLCANPVCASSTVSKMTAGKGEVALGESQLSRVNSAEILGIWGLL